MPIHDKMEGVDYESLRGLYQDLSSLSRDTLPNLDRLVLALEDTIEDLRHLLDKPTKKDESRKQVISGKIVIDDVEYAANSEFQQEALQVAEALDIDEILAAKCVFQVQQSLGPGRSAVLATITAFHKRRSFLLECLRLVFLELFESERNETRTLMESYVAKIVEPPVGYNNNGSMFVKKCMDGMSDIEKWLVVLAEQAQKAPFVGVASAIDVLEIIEFQRDSLLKQHESLGAVLAYLLAWPSSNAEDFAILLEKLRKIQRLDPILVHYIPSVTSASSRFGSDEWTGSRRVPTDLNKTITELRDVRPWEMPHLHAAISLFWIAEHSSWLDLSASSVKERDDNTEESDPTKIFRGALEDGGLEFIVAMCASTTPTEQLDIGKSELVSYLLRDTQVPSFESYSLTDYFNLLLMQHVEKFVESLIANLPDAVRSLRASEDQSFEPNIHQLPSQRALPQTRLHLESLLIIMAFAFEKRPDAAQEFWGDPEGNLYGFLQWASKRQTIPRASAFCELLRSISEGEENSALAHAFLINESSSSSRTRRSNSLSWDLMLSELQQFAEASPEKAATTTPTFFRPGLQESLITEDEGNTDLLTYYLRLISHLCSQNWTVREWLLGNQSFNFISILLSLCNTSTLSTLQAAVFLTLRSLMIDRTSGDSNDMWTLLDNFISSPRSVPAAAANTTAANSVIWKDKSFQRILENYDQTNAFVELIAVLCSTPTDMTESQLALPFPENLGSSYRMPGIEPYIDFVMGRVFASSAVNLPESKVQLLRLNCLEFATVCLQSLSEKLVLVLNQPDSPMDSNSRAAALNRYVRLHPFSRIMDWLFNDDVLKVLFAISHQDIGDVRRASPDSVLIQCLARTLDIMSLLMNLQSTYFNIFRPMIRLSSTSVISNTVANPSLTSFEDVVMDNLGLVSDLCLYWGADHPPLTILSLGLLDQLACSQELNNRARPTTVYRWQAWSQFVEAMENQIDVTRVAQSLASQMAPDVREVEGGPESSGYLIKLSISNLLSRCLETVPDKPNVSHVLLGFTCLGSVLDSSPDGLEDPKMALLSAIIDIMREFPVTTDGVNVISWMIRLKRACFQIMKYLWSSKLSCNLVLPSLFGQLLQPLLLSELPMDASRLWDLRKPTEEVFWTSDSAIALSEFIRFRALFFEYMTTEIRYTCKYYSQSTVRIVLSTVLGTSIDEKNNAINHASLFDLLDFADIEVNVPITPPPLKFFADIDINIVPFVVGESGVEYYDLVALQEVLDFAKTDVYAAGRIVTSQDEKHIVLEREALLLYCRGLNQNRMVLESRYQAIRAWAELATTILLTCDMETNQKAIFSLHVLQAILPKLEVSVNNNAAEAMILAQLAETVIQKLDSSNQGRGGDVVYERLNFLFQTCIFGIPSVVENVGLRESLYGICSRYLSRIVRDSTTQCAWAHRAVQTSGFNLIEIICDDAYSGEDYCKVSALLLLNLLSILDQKQGSTLVIDAITRSNYLSMFIDVIRSIPFELRQVKPIETPHLLTYFKAQLALLLQISRSRVGADRLLNAGLFEAVHESQLFTIDPDIGLDIDNPDALQDYHDLLLSILQIIVSIVAVRGVHNKLVFTQTRHFLSEHRSSVVGVFKRWSKLGSVNNDNEKPSNRVLDDLVNIYVALITAVDFLEFEGFTGFERSTPLRFS